MPIQMIVDGTMECPSCKGQGFIHIEWPGQMGVRDVTCQRCFGAGHVPRYRSVREMPEDVPERWR